MEELPTDGPLGEERGEAQPEELDVADVLAGIVRARLGRWLPIGWRGGWHGGLESLDALLCGVAKEVAEKGVEIVDDVGLVYVTEGLEVNLLLDEAQGAPGLDGVDGDHPENAYVVSLESASVVDYVHVDCMQRNGDGERDKDGPNAPSYNVLGFSIAYELPYSHSDARKQSQVCNHHQPKRGQLPPLPQADNFLSIF